MSNFYNGSNSGGMFHPQSIENNKRLGAIRCSMHRDVWAIQNDGSPDCLQKIREFCRYQYNNQYEVNFQYTDREGVLHTVDRIRGEPIRVGYWVIEYDDSIFAIMYPEPFKARFKLS